MPNYNDSTCDDLWRKVLDARKAANEVTNIPEAEQYYAARDRSDKAQKDMDAFNEEANQRQQPVNQLKDGLSSLEKEISGIRQQFTDTQVQARLKGEALKPAKETHAANVTALETKATELKKAADTLQQIAETSDGSITVAVGTPSGGVAFEKVQVDDVFIQIAQEKRDQLQKEYDSLMATADQSQAGVSALETQIVDLTQGLAKIQQTTAQMEKDAGKMKEEIEARERENAQYQVEWERLQKEVIDARDDAAVAKDTYEEAKKRFDPEGLTNRMNDLQDEYWANCQFNNRRHFSGQPHGPAQGESLQCWCGQNHGRHSTLGLTTCWCGVYNDYIGQPR